MKTKLWGGIADGTEIEISEDFARQCRPIIVAIPTRPATAEYRPNSVWADTINGGRPDQHRYDHHEIGGNYNHPCVKGVIVQCWWDFWSRDLTMNGRLVSLVTAAQRPNRIKFVVTQDFPWIY